MPEQTDPQSTDLVMGGTAPSPIDAVVLGGISGLKARFEHAEIEQKRSILSEAIQYGEEGIALLWRGLEDDSLKVRSHSYFLLKSVGVQARELEMGIPLKVGDHIYGVYQSSVTYGDDWYYINSSIDDEEEDDEDWDDKPDFYHVGQTKEGKEFVYISEVPGRDPSMSEYDYYHPSLVRHYIEQVVAEEVAQAVYCNHFSDLYCEIHEIDETWSAPDIDLRAWVETNNITIDAVFTEDRGGWGDQEWQYRCRVLMSLQKQKQFNRLRELWEQLEYSPLGFVHEHLIDRTCYLRLSNDDTTA
ncbi:hypothetical protein IQ250_12165 [Pseudanabaenaceae cyanobacterium LEGE 13415]|nr:hypothetical protein [Pseudanabaenaceae cyanobacterium LEGE 13415]